MISDLIDFHPLVAVFTRRRAIVGQTMQLSKKAERFDVQLVLEQKSN
jgi:hypothetical protein